MSFVFGLEVTWDLLSAQLEEEAEGERHMLARYFGKRERGREKNPKTFPGALFFVSVPSIMFLLVVESTISHRHFYLIHNTRTRRDDSLPLPSLQVCII